MLAALAAATAAITVQSPAPVQALAVDAHRAAYAAGRSARDCNRVYVWNLRTRGVSRLGRATHCVATSTGNAIPSLALAGTRAVWLHYAGGNRRRYTLWTATTSRPRPRLLASQEVDVDDPAPIVLGAGDASRLGDTLPYAVGRVVTVLGANGARRLRWTAPARVVALDSHAGEVAVATEAATVLVLDLGGRVLREERYDEPVKAVRLTGSGIVVHRGGRIELRDGAGARSWRVGTNVRLESANAVRALYANRSEIRSLRFTPYTDRGAAFAQHGRLEGTTFVTASGRTLRARPFA